MVDGICIAEHCCLVALAICADGTTLAVGLWLGDTEDTTVVSHLLADLHDRGLDASRGLLVVLDGAKALDRAVDKVFSDLALVQRCTIHRSRKQSTCRRAGVRGGGRGRHRGQEFRGGAVADWWRCGGVPGLFEERAGLADCVADRGPADLQKVGEDVHRAQSALGEDGHKDTFAVADLLVEDAAAGGTDAGHRAADS